ncbi:PdaC/SigV domain-containing protein [Paenibacillus donghaensis]|uniref:Copper amine oxidase n=1 Tax=Paenibacillus donghaensis TaxID=414771 RepID=A0A2Z2KNG9_9BACL|nr:DUF4163 domain-containing protein [Paenibacillus donghaensis]ASA25133.1 hypothetical protein B9T62_32985 [Paenibacillus donghaensis]
MSYFTKKHARQWGTGLLIAGLLAGGGLLPAETSHAAATTQKQAASIAVLKYNGAITQQTGVVVNGEVWVPVTFLRDVLKMPLAYDKAENAYTVGSGVKQVKLSLYNGSASISVNNVYIKDHEGKLLNNRLYVPAGLLSDYLGYKTDWSASSGRLNVVAKANNALTITTQTISNNKQDVTVELDYPQISGMANAAAQARINSLLKQDITNFAAAADKGIKNRGKEENPYEYESSYLVSYNQDGVLSLITNQYSYMGGAHGNTYRQGYTFSLKNGKRLLLGDLFGANSSYKKQLNAKLDKLVKAEGGYLGGFNGLTSEKFFYLKEGQVVLFFQPYEYTAYAAGSPEYSFSFKELLPDGSSPFAAYK